jgi:hypothetical protein
MKHPHPWLARVARLGMALAVVSGMAAVGATLLLPTSGWYGSYLLEQWQQATTVGQRLDVVRVQFVVALTVLVPSLGWLLAAGLLRLAATGRIRPGGRGVSGRWLAVGGMACGAGAVVAGVGLWESPFGYSHPFADGSRVAARFERALTTDAQSYLPAPVSGHPVSIKTYGPGQPVSPDMFPRRLALTLCLEAGFLLDYVRVGGLLFFLSGAVYCLARPTDDEG